MNFKLPSWTEQHRFYYRGEMDLKGPLLHRLEAGLERYSAREPVVSVVIPAYNEARNLLHTLSSLAALELPGAYPTELLVVDDASTDATPRLLEKLSVPYLRLPTNQQPKGARQAGLERARGRYLLQADADTLYPPRWGLAYVRALRAREVALVYGNHAFVPSLGVSRVALAFHELAGEALYRFRRRHREYINVHGFNSAFRREDALRFGSYDHDELGSEDGQMALSLMQVGKLRFIPGPDCTAWTSDRRILADGGVWQGFVRRAGREGRRLWEYAFRSQPPGA
jgi:glycosyltransferase involved in cell wall biosynthesis